MEYLKICLIGGLALNLISHLKAGDVQWTFKVVPIGVYNYYDLIQSIILVGIMLSVSFALKFDDVYTGDGQVVGIAGIYTFTAFFCEWIFKKGGEVFKKTVTNTADKFTSSVTTVIDDKIVEVKKDITVTPIIPTTTETPNSETKQ